MLLFNGGGRCSRRLCRIIVQTVSIGGLTESRGMSLNRWVQVSTVVLTVLAQVACAGHKTLTGLSGGQSELIAYPSILRSGLPSHHPVLYSGLALAAIIDRGSSCLSIYYKGVGLVLQYLNWLPEMETRGSAVWMREFWEFRECPAPRLAAPLPQALG